MKIEIATIDDVPELMELHDKAFFAIAAEVSKTGRCILAA